jgi:hypothetical protein
MARISNRYTHAVIALTLSSVWALPVSDDEVVTPLLPVVDLGYARFRGTFQAGLE